MLDLKDIVRRWAYIDPLLAFYLMKRSPQRKDFQMSVMFVDGTPNKPLEASLQTKMNCDYFVADLMYTIRRPSRGEQGNIFDSLNNVMSCVLPGIGVDLRIEACPNLVITDGIQPLETVAKPPVGQSMVHQEFPLLWDTSLTALFSLYETIPESQLPITVYLVTKGFVLPCQGYNADADEEDVDRACYHLSRDYGVDVPRSRDAIEQISARILPRKNEP